VLTESTVAPRAVVELHRRPDASPTFEGRDVFAPAAAALCHGRTLRSLGSPVTGPLAPLPVRSPAVLWVDRFGNLVTSLKPPVTALRVGGHEVTAVARTFSEAPPDTPFLYVGSMGFVEVGVRKARADERLGARAGSPVELL